MDKHRIRRAILEAVEAQEPGLAKVDDIAAFPLIAMAHVPPEALMDAIGGLVEHGFLDDARPGRAPLLRMTAAGRDQMRQESDLDEYVWGEMASKFHQR
jgi:hypothetical protein